MDILDDVRAAFEKLYKEQAVFIENTHGYDSQKFALWAGFQLGWQASRESLEVELPSDVITGHDGMFDEGLAIGYNNALEECKEILDSNGVKIKNE
ncbi:MULTISPECIES: hypothetical protein [unclassified Proteus (in: enterobacteria)]|uniref:hypothetical protein n=1 Tax=unclassified Proteus (in: enterobacteria) TaxID=257482 RepID=UPI00137808E5|nr:MULTISPECIES: hypothetical protein [unclassified Proteus (in: enterobacteria)]NBM10988.1 hypothetical protein [Proteus sp. G2670]NBM31069.1 hypothetical protein [Proteus sp. G2664]